VNVKRVKAFRSVSGVGGSAFFTTPAGCH